MIRQSISCLLCHVFVRPPVLARASKEFLDFDGVSPSEVERLISALSCCKSSAMDVILVHVWIEAMFNCIPSAFV